jgi:hypothetical protein
LQSRKAGKIDNNFTRREVEICPQGKEEQSLLRTDDLPGSDDDSLTGPDQAAPIK